MAKRKTSWWRAENMVFWNSENEGCEEQRFLIELFYVIWAMSNVAAHSYKSNVAHGKSVSHLTVPRSAPGGGKMMNAGNEDGSTPPFYVQQKEKQHSQQHACIPSGNLLIIPARHCAPLSALLSWPQWQAKYWSLGTRSEDLGIATWQHSQSC